MTVSLGVWCLDHETAQQPQLEVRVEEVGGQRGQGWHRGPWFQASENVPLERDISSIS